MITVFLADDQRLVREGLKSIVNKFAGFEVVAECDNTDRALQLVKSSPSDILLLEIMMPGSGALDPLHRMARLDSKTKIAALTCCDTAPFPSHALRLGAKGYLSKNISAEELETALKQIHFGRTYICREIAQQLAYYAFSSGRDNPFDSLSYRELQVMLMVARCTSAREIAEALHLSPKTVNSYRYRVFEKLQVSGDVELTLLAMKYGIVKQASITQNFSTDTAFEATQLGADSDESAAINGVGLESRQRSPLAAEQTVSSDNRYGAGLKGPHRTVAEEFHPTSKTKAMLAKRASDKRVNI